MSDYIHFTAKFPNIEQANLENFKEHAAAMLERANSEPGLLHYDLYFNADESVCVVRETFADSQAVLDHMARIGDLFPRAVELGGGLDSECYGNPSPALADVLARFGQLNYAYFHGK
jgi:quinol monooxygenase YgiN